MKPLNRPMFRYGGPIKEGVMSGIQERVPYKTGGGYLKNLGGAIANFYNPLKKAKPIQKIINKIKPTSVPKIRQTNLDKPIGMRGTLSERASKIPFMERAGMFVKQNPVQVGVAAPFVASGALTAAPPVAKGIGSIAKATGMQLADLAVPDFIFDQDQYFKDKEEAKIKKELEASELTAQEKKIKELEALLAGGNKPDLSTKSAEELRADKIAKYRDIVDIKGMNKDAAYNSLIAASQAINESGDFKGDIKSGKLINQIIQGASKSFDKPKQTKDAIDTLILKGEIEADIAAGKPSTYLKAAQDMVATGAAKNITEAMKTLTKSENSMSTTLAAVLAKGQKLDDKLVGVAYREETGKIPAGSVKLSEVNEWKEDNAGKTEVDYVKELLTKTEIAPGDYVIGERVVTVDEDKTVSFFY